jgi:hypothetical protein
MKILSKISGPVQDRGRWLPLWNGKIYNRYKDLNMVGDIRIRRLRSVGGGGDITRIENEMIPKPFSMENFITQDQWENQERARKTCEDAGNLEMEETSRRQRRMEASFKN